MASGLCVGGLGNRVAAPTRGSARTPARGARCAADVASAHARRAAAGRTAAARSDARDVRFSQCVVFLPVPAALTSMSRSRTARSATTQGQKHGRRTTRHFSRCNAQPHPTPSPCGRHTHHPRRAACTATAGRHRSGRARGCASALATVVRSEVRGITEVRGQGGTVLGSAEAGNRTMRRAGGRDGGVVRSAEHDPSAARALRALGQHD